MVFEKKNTRFSRSCVDFFLFFLSYHLLSPPEDTAPSKGVSEFVCGRARVKVRVRVNVRIGTGVRTRGLNLG